VALVEIDLAQVLVNALAAGFGMGMANEIYHAFMDYRKLVKKRLLDEALISISVYREAKAGERYRNLPRRAAGSDPLTPTPVIIYHRPQPQPFLGVESIRPLRREALIEPTPVESEISYTTHTERPQAHSDIFSRMAEWES
jgi:hypothetical protein